MATPTRAADPVAQRIAALTAADPAAVLPALSALAAFAAASPAAVDRLAAARPLVPALVGLLRPALGMDVVRSALGMLHMLAAGLPKAQDDLVRQPGALAAIGDLLRDCSMHLESAHGLVMMARAAELLRSVVQLQRAENDAALREQCSVDTLHALVHAAAGIRASRPRVLDDSTGAGEAAEFQRAVWDLVREALVCWPDALQDALRTRETLRAMVAHLCDVAPTEALMLAVAAAVDQNKESQAQAHELGVTQALVQALADGDRAALLLAATLQFQNTVIHTALAEAGAPAELEQCARVYRIVYEETRNIRKNHLDESEVAGSLELLGKAAAEGQQLGRYVISHTRAGMAALVQSLNNIDETIMVAACEACSVLLRGSSAAQREFVRLGGVGIIVDCLRDYNVQVKLLALEMATTLLRASRAHRELARRAGLVSEMTKQVGQYPSDDVTPPVLSGLVMALGLAAAGNRANQDVVLATQVLDRVGPGADDEATLTLLANASYRHSEIQSALHELGVVPRCVAMAFDRKEHVSAALNVLINCADTHQGNQEAIAGLVSAAQIERLLDGDGDRPLLGCVLVSHLTWSHTRNQAKYGTAGIVGALERMLLTAKKGAQTRETVCVLTAITNMSHRNRGVQDLMVRRDVPLRVLELVRAAEYDVRKTAAFCLGSFVKETPQPKGLADKLCGEQAVPILVEALNDEDDDDLSNKAFETLMCLKEPAVDTIVRLTREMLRTGDQEALEDLLPKLLPALNGFVCLHEDMRVYYCRMHEFGPLPAIVAHPGVDRALSRYALGVLANLTSACPKPMQAQAGRSGVVDQVVRFVAEGETRDEDDEDDEDEEDEEESRASAYQTLSNVCLGHKANLDLLVGKGIEFLQRVVADCSTQEAAAELVVTMLEHRDLRRRLMSRGIADRLREILRKIDARASPALKAKVEQALRDL